MPSLKCVGIDETRFSMIIPTLNEEKIIGDTLTHLRGLCPKAKVIVADGRSEDHTVEIAKKFGAVVVSEKKGFRSIAAGRNAGAREASTDLVLFVDADTKPQCSFFERMLKEFEDERVVAVGCKIMPSTDSWFTTFMFEFFNLMILGSVLLGKATIAGNCVAYRRKVFEEVKGFDEDMHASEDQDLCYRVSQHGRVVYLRGVTAFTSSRRLKAFGWPGLLMDWGKTTLYLLSGRKITRYAIVREV